MPQIKTKTIGYLRISTLEQDIEKNKSDILIFAHNRKLGQVDFIDETVTGKVSWKKRKLFNVMEGLNKGDTLIVSELSRLGRSMLEIMEILSVSMQKGINVYAIKGDWKLDSSIQSKVVAMAFSMASEIERDLISQRTKEALRVKKAQGVKLGRPKGPGKSKLDKFKPEIQALLANGSTQKFIANRYDTTEANLHNWLKKNNIKKQNIEPTIKGYDFNKPYTKKSDLSVFTASDKETSKRYGSHVKALFLSNREYQHRYDKLHKQHKMKRPPLSGRIFGGYLVVRNLNSKNEYETWIPDYAFEEIYIKSDNV